MDIQGGVEMTEREIDDMLAWAVARHESLRIAATEACKRRDEAEVDRRDVALGQASDRCIAGFHQWKAMQRRGEAKT